MASTMCCQVLTGLAQISGRDELEIPIKVQYDKEYVEDITFLNDVKIVLKTALSVVKTDGVQEGGTGAMGIEARTQYPYKRKYS